MTRERGTTCPECGTPRGADNTPSCDCTARASEALRETRTAEAAAAEDFDPLRIRPYVEMRPAPEGPPPAPPAATAPPAEMARPQQPPAPLAETARPPQPPAPPAETALPPQPPAETAAQPHPPAPLGAAAEPDAPTDDLEAGPPRRRSRRTVLLAAGGAGAAVVAVAGFALFSYRAPARDQVVQEVRESIPGTTTRAPSSAPAPAPPVTPRPPLSSPSATADPSPSRGSAPPSPTATASASASRAAASPTPSTTPSGTPGTTPAAPPVLRRGDTGPEVTELQQRLRQLNLYGDQVNGTFTRPVEDAVRNYQLARGITGDDLGTYGAATRRSLESETTEP
ncbi:peptidoglycan-binding protein [Streptomyces sp. Ru62]|uniref:peptidoglycan-binding domain-containing protein n=1 Tax=Streptomyces sp. Ru62 TaxID=2080745 RepID=UPI000CDD9B85|nr:peptidoglycan-binding domain-containing protein [Streptomyces sp. Ru62]POX64210.1 peptidoglycan-binding protein [Streptomyces sp. Ru62]